jgi:APA family basic amino acid/polyamine antiporter
LTTESSDVGSSENKPNGLRRDLGLQIAVAVVVGNVIGSGIFLKPGNIAAESGDFRLILTVWVFGGLLCMLGGLCFAELATMLPEAGGLYVYLREAYGKLVGFLFGWTEVIFGKPASIGALSVAFIGSLSLAIGWSPSPAAEVLIAAVLIVTLAGINILGVVWGGRMQWLTTVIKAGFLAAVALLPFVLIPFVSDSIDTANYLTKVTPRQASLAGQVGAVLLAVMWAYNGWHGITALAEEVRNPQRNIPLALFIGIGILIVLYVSANVAYHGVLTMEELRQAGDHGAEQMLLKLLGKTGLAAMSAVIMCSTFGAINTNLLQAPRISFAMGRDGVFFRTLGNVHANYRTPAPAIAVMAAMSIALIITVSVSKGLVQNLEPSSFESEFVSRIVASLKDDSIFSLLTNFVIFSASIFYVLGVLAVIVLRLRRPELSRPYRTLGYPVTPLLFLAVYAWFLAQVYSTNPLESRVGIVLIAVGIPVFFAYRAIAGRRESP